MKRKLLIIFGIFLLCYFKLILAAEQNEGNKSLEHTRITPHLESKITLGENLVYCSTFQIAWNSLQDNIVNDRLQLKRNQDFADYLNKQLSSINDLDEDCYVAISGYLSNELIDKINNQLKLKFGNHAPIFMEREMNDPDATIITYSYLFKEIVFKKRFEVINENLHFQYGDQTILLQGFGVKPNNADSKLRKQVTIIDESIENGFIVELETTSRTDQVVLAKIEPKDSLLETISYVQEKVKESNSKKFLRKREALIIPKIDFSIKHSFSELENNVILNLSGNWHIAQAEQWVNFKLDEQGLTMESDSFMVMLRSIPNMYVFDKPFLLYIKKSSAKYPYLAIWVEHPEILIQNEI